MRAESIKSDWRQLNSRKSPALVSRSRVLQIRHVLRIIRINYSFVSPGNPAGTNIIQLYGHGRGKWNYIRLFV